MSDLLTAPGILAYLAIVNGVTLLRFWDDKRRACHGLRRISESDLLGLALIGGTPGAYAARRLFRHKTRKQPFSNRLFAILLVQLFAAAFLLVFLA